MSEQNLKQKLLALCELDAAGLQKRLQITAETSAIVQALIDILCQQRAALENECCCPGEKSWTTRKDIKCDACEAITATDEALKRMGCET